MEEDSPQESENQKIGVPKDDPLLNGLQNFQIPEQIIIEDQSLNQKNNVFKGIFKGKAVALKKVAQEDWDKLLALKNENIVTYHYVFIRDSTK